MLWRQRTWHPFYILCDALISLTTESGTAHTRGSMLNFLAALLSHQTWPCGRLLRHLSALKLTESDRKCLSMILVRKELTWRTWVLHLASVFFDYTCFCSRFIKQLLNHIFSTFAASVPLSLSTDLHAEFIPLPTYNWGQNGLYKLSNRLPFNPVVYCLIASFHAFTFWVCLELTIHLFFTFKRRESMYFWYVL